MKKSKDSSSISPALVEAWIDVSRVLDEGNPTGETEMATMNEMLRCFDGEIKPKTVLSRTKNRLAAQHVGDPHLR